MCEFENVSFKVKCPYCGFEQWHRLSNMQLGRVKQIWCDVDEGGCDEMFGVAVSMDVSAIIYKLERVQ